MNGSNRGHAASPSPCESNRALGVTDSSVSTHCPSLACQNLPRVFTLVAAPLSTAGDTALGQLQPPLYNKPCRHLPDPPWEGRKGHLGRNRSISSLHCAALIMESFWCSVQRAQNKVPLGSTTLLGTSPLTAGVAKGHIRATPHKKKGCCLTSRVHNAVLQRASVSTNLQLPSHLWKEVVC